MTREIRVAIMQICKVFKVICQKVYNLATFQHLKIGNVSTLCVLEKMFLPSFFDLMTHLVIHLVDELDICRHVHYRWSPYEVLNLQIMISRTKIH
jgi:hypothetical protein